MSTVIYQASYDENGKIKGGRAGNQTKKELNSRAWYLHSAGWTAVYEPPTLEAGARVAKEAKAAVYNYNIGYDQAQRNSLLNEAKKCIWSLANINNLCETDCSALATVCAIAAGADESIMVQGGNCATSSTIGERLKKCGWKEHKERKYLTSSEYAGEGWIYVSAGHHVIINGTNGKYYNGGSSSANSGASGGTCPYAEPTKSVNLGMSGTSVSWVQWHLNSLIDSGVLVGFARLVVDGSWGRKTQAVFTAFQTLHPETGTNGKPDGSCGPVCRKVLKECVANVAKSQAASGIVHTVQKGETLTGIAKKYGTTVAALAKLNGIADPNSIGIGQKIRIS